jgi:cytochrome P450
MLNWCAAAVDVRAEIGYNRAGGTYRPRYAYFPFGGGPHICLGNSLSSLEAALAVAMIAQRYRLRLVPGREIEPQMVGTLRPSGPVMMEVQPR